MNIPRPMRLAMQSVNSNSPTILSGIAVAGVIATAILAVRGTPKAVKLITSAKEDVYEEGLTLQEADDIRESNYANWNIVKSAKVAWRPYIPAAATGIATIACIIGANQIGLRRNAALLGAYTIVDSAFREYKEEVVKQLGETKERKVHDAVAQKQVDDHPVSSSQVIITGGGDSLCYESLSGRYFKSDKETISQAQNDFNRAILLDGYGSGSLNEFWEYLGLRGTTVGEELGFNIENNVELAFSSHLADDGRPCLAIGYVKYPIKDFGKL